MFKKITALSAIIIIQTVLAILMGGAFLSRASAGKILPGISAAGIYLGGMSPGEAEEILRDKYRDAGSGVLILEGWGRRWEIPMKDIGAVYDYRECVNNAYSVGRAGSLAKRVSELLGNKTENVSVPLPVRFDRDALQTLLAGIGGEYAKEPVNARLVLENKEIRVIPCEEGMEMDIQETMRRVTGLQAGMVFVVSIAAQSAIPRIRDGDIFGLTDVLGECVTLFDAASEGRAANIARAAGLIDGLLLEPGDTFSFNSAISPADHRGGFRKAPMIADGRMVEDYGGGVCQVATTLYGSVLLSGLEIVERHPHSRPVKYVPPGLDATVAEGLADFRFRNNLDRPVYIMSSGDADGGSVRVAVIGRKSGKAAYIITTESKTISPGMVIRSNPGLRAGESAVAAHGSPGFEVSVYRISVIEGTEGERELISHDFYPPEPRVIEIGISSGG